MVPESSARSELTAKQSARHRLAQGKRPLTTGIVCAGTISRTRAGTPRVTGHAAGVPGAPTAKRCWDPLRSCPCTLSCRPPPRAAADEIITPWGHAKTPPAHHPGQWRPTALPGSICAISGAPGARACARGACACARARARVCLCVCMRVHVCVWARACVYVRVNFPENRGWYPPPPAGALGRSAHVCASVLPALTLGCGGTAA